MKKELGAVTSIVIAHRLSTVRNADKIIVVKKGRKTEEGSHEELLEKFPNGTYAKLVRTQRQTEDDESEAVAMSSI